MCVRLQANGPPGSSRPGSQQQHGGGSRLGTASGSRGSHAVPAPATPHLWPVTEDEEDDNGGVKPLPATWAATLPAALEAATPHVPQPSRHSFIAKDYGVEGEVRGVLLDLGQLLGAAACRGLKKARGCELGGFSGRKP